MSADIEPLITKSSDYIKLPSYYIIRLNLRFQRIAIFSFQSSIEWHLKIRPALFLIILTPNVTVFNTLGHSNNT